MAGNLQLDQQAQFILALATVRQGLIPRLANDQFSVITIGAQLDATEVATIAGYRQGAQSSIAATQYGLYFTTATTNYNAALSEANIQGGATATIAGYEVNNTIATSTAQANQVTGSSNAQVQEITQVANVQATASAQNAAIQSSTLASLATIDATQTTSIASIQASTTTTEASINATEGTILASLQAGEITQQAAIQVAERGKEQAIRVAQYQADAQIQAILTATLASIQTNEITQDAVDQVAQIYGEAQQDYRGTTGAATIRANETVAVATIRADSEIAIAEINATYSIYVAMDRSQGVHFRADQELIATEFEATSQQTLVQYRADQDYAGNVVQANQSLQGVQYAADGEYTRQTERATIEAAAREFGADLDLDGVEAREASLDAILQSRLAYLLGKWNLILADWHESLKPRTIPGFATVLPEISGRGTYSPAQIQQKTNQAYSAAEVAAQSQLHAAQSDFTGRGFSGVSPALFGIQAQLFGTKLRAIAGAGGVARIALLGGNAEQVLAFQELRSQLFMAQQLAYVEAEATWIKRQVGELDELSRLVSAL